MRSNSDAIPGERDVGEFPLAYSTPGTTETHPSNPSSSQVALIGPNHIDSIVVTWAVLRLGGIILSVCNYTSDSSPLCQPSDTDEPIPVLQILRSLQSLN